MRAHTVAAPTRTANNAHRLKTKKEILAFYHAAAGWPTKPTWAAAIKRNAYASWPGLDEQMVNKHHTQTIPTILGHLHAR